ncbi:MAG: hypothetical protein QXQ94_06300 [Candidatus Bathyarchaeia archaeon]
MVDITPKRALANIADFIVKKRYHTNWVLMAGLVDYNLEKNPRLIRSQSFGDPDYPGCVLKFLEDVYKQNPEDAKFVISRIVRDEDENDVLDSEYRPAFEALEIIPKSGITTPILVPIIRTKYLDVSSFPHDFYKELIEQINACYQHGLYPAAQILIRKLLENCLIDILRRRYGMAGIDLFFNTRKGHFHDFSVLLDNVSKNIRDFIYVRDSFNEDLIKRIDGFREQGNASAHNINLNTESVRSELDKSRGELNFIVKSLFRTIDNLST